MSLTYKEFFKKGIDLAPLGIDSKEHFVKYFCTPKGASIIASAGIDGIHFCFIKGFGEMVFAISPCNGIGEYVHPIAKNFEDLLSLLVSTGNTAILEQAWQWDKEEFYRFLQENSPTEEQETLIQKLKNDLSISVMDDPFSYIKDLQTKFNYSQIKFTAEYYDVVSDESETPKEPREWQVYYDNGYWEPRTNKALPGTELSLNKRFIWGDEIWHIPSMYICGKGFVIDYCVEIEPQKVKAFIDKWEPTRLSEENISDEVRQQIDRENPLEVEFLSHYMLNKKSVEQERGSGLSYIPDFCLPSGVKNPKETLAIIEHYHLDLTKAWSFHRHSYPWATVRKPKEIKSFSLRLERHPETIQGIHFKNPSVGDVITFTHPISGTEHKLTVFEYERQQLPSDFFANEEYEYPTNCTVMTYALEPPLSQATYTVCDCTPNDQPKCMPKNPYEPNAAYSVAFIGGADGPTAIVMSSENCDSEVHTALSALHFDVVSDIEWKIEFRAKMVEDIEVTLI